MDKFNLDLSLVARLGSHSAPRNPSRQGAFPRHDHHLCPDSDGGESCQKDRQGEDQSTCYGVDYERRSVHWSHLREGRSYFKWFGPVIFASGGFSAASSCPCKAEGQNFCTPDRTQYRIRSPRLAASFQMLLTRCEFCPVDLNVKVMKFKQEQFSSNCFHPCCAMGSGKQWSIGTVCQVKVLMSLGLPLSRIAAKTGVVLQTLRSFSARLKKGYIRVSGHFSLCLFRGTFLCVGFGALGQNSQRQWVWVSVRSRGWSGPQERQ